MFDLPTTSPDRIALACEQLRAADKLIASSIAMLSDCDVEASTGLSTELMLGLQARRTRGDASVIANAAQVSRIMPCTFAAFRRGDLSWGQVRAICASVRSVDAAGRAQIDSLVASLAPGLSASDPGLLLGRVEDAVGTLRADLAVRREQRAIDTSFFAIQGRLDGGGRYYGEGDAQSTATIASALDAISARVVDPNAEDAPTRAQQRFQGFVALCESYLGGGGSHAGTRPRPPVIATVDVNELAADASGAGARILWALAGPKPRITRLSTETMLCDAVTNTVFLRDGQPVAVGGAYSPISTTLRTALIARDQGCRFPGCAMPHQWTDAHHVTPRLEGGPTSIENLILLCRRCHGLVHRNRWKISQSENGGFEFRRRGVRYVSPSRMRAPPRE